MKDKRGLRHVKLKEAILDLVDSGKLKRGTELPSYAELAKMIGGSPKSIMPAVLELEHDGVLIRMSPRKIAVAEDYSIDSSENGWGSQPVGLINFGGHIFEEMGNELVRRLHDRKIPSSIMIPLGKSEIEMSRWFKRFFSSEYKALIVRDSISMPVAQIESHISKISRLIVTDTPFNIWQTPHYGVYVDRAFCAYDALRRMKAAGCSRIHVLAGGPPPGALNPRDRYDKGHDKFLRETDSRKCECLVHSPYELFYGKETAVKKWVSSLKEGDGIFAHRDFDIVKTQEWIAKFGTADFRKFLYIGVGNTDWSQHGVHPFPSYDFRCHDMEDMILEIIDSDKDVPEERRIKPVFVREDLLCI